MTELFTILGKIAIENSGANGAMDETADKAKSFSEKLSGGFQTVGKNASSLGTKMSIGLTAPLTLIGKKAINAASDFEYSMSEVAAISGATGDDLALLESKAKEMGETTKFSASESAEALKYMAMAGWKTSDMLDGLEGIMNLAAASGEDLGTTSDIVTDALSAFGLTASDSGHFADVLAKASSNANTNVSMMGETFKYIAPVAGALGFSAEDTALAIGLMANSGIKASQAGTSLRGALTNLANPTDTMAGMMVKLGLATEDTTNVIDSGKLQKAQAKVENKTIDMEKAQIKYNDAIAKYGVNSSQAQTAALNLEKAQNNLEAAVNDLNAAQKGSVEVTGINNNLLVDSEGKTKSLREVMVTLRSAFSGLTEEEQAQAAATLFGKEAMSGMLAIINASDSDFNKLVSSIDSADGAAKEMADTMNDNLSGQITLLKSQLEGLAIQFVTLIMPHLRQGVEWLSKVCDWIAGLDDGTKMMIMTIGGFLAAAGPVLIFLGKVSTGIGSVIKVGGSLIGGIGKLGPAVSGVISMGGKLAGGIGSLVGKVTGGGGLLSALAAIPGPVWIVIGIFAALVTAGVLIYKNWDEIKEWAGKTWDSIQDIVGKAVDGIRNFFSGIIDFAKDNWQGLALLLVNPFIGGFKLLYDNCDSFREFVDGFLNKLKDGFHNFAEGVSRKAGELKDKVVTKAKELKDGAVEKFHELKEKGTEKFEELKEKASGRLEELKGKASSKISALKEDAVAKFHELKEKASGKIAELKEDAVAKFHELKENASARIGELKESAVSKFEELRGGASEKIRSLQEKGIAGFEALRSGAVEKFENLKSGVTQKLEAVKNFVSNTVQKLKDFFHFDWSLPKIKLPHFSMEGKFSLDPPSIPHIGVEWYKKAMDRPILMEKPTAFGINGAGQLMAGGEAGSEVVSGTETLMGMISAAVAGNNGQICDALERLHDLLERYLPALARRQLVLDSGALVGELAGPMNEELGRIIHMRGRRN